MIDKMTKRIGIVKLVKVHVLRSVLFANLIVLITNNNNKVRVFNYVATIGTKSSR